MTAETPKIIQQIGNGMASHEVAAVVGSAGAATVTGAVWTVTCGTVWSGCVFVIFTVGDGGAAGCGRMLMRAVSFFGPACAADPG